jgi:hypothetical protein
MKNLNLIPLIVAGMAGALGYPGTCKAADVSWTKAAGGNWNVATNWSTGTVPGPGDNVSITLPGTYTVTLNANASVASLTVGGDAGLQTLAIASSSYTLTLNGPGLINGNGVLNLSAGTITGNGDLTVAGSMNWSGGTLSGAGLTAISSNGTLNLTSAAAKSLNGRTINSAGRVIVSGAGTFQMSAQATLNNQEGGTVDIQTDANLTSSGTPASVFNNAGVLVRSSGNNIATIGAVFNNTKTVQLKTGTLRLSGGGTSSGDINGDAATILRFGSSYELTAAGTVTSAGLVDFNSGTVNVAAAYNVTGSTTVSGNTATANFTGAVVSVGSLLTITSGTANFNTNSVATTDLVLSGGTLASRGTVTVSGTLSWSAGNMAGGGTTVLPAGGVLNITGLASKGLNARTLNLAGSTTWTDNGTVTLQGGSTINNQTGATFEVQGDSSLTSSGTPASVFSNAGTFTRSASVGTMTVSCQFDSSGTVSVQSGVLNLRGGGTGTSVFQGSAGTTLRFGAGYTFTATSKLTSPGIVDFNAGTINVGGTYDVSGTTSVSGATTSFTGTLAGVGNTVTLSAGTADFGTTPITTAALNLAGGTLASGADFTVTVSLAWSGGAMSGGGTAVIPGGATLTVSGLASKQLSERNLSLAGNGVWKDNGTITMSGAATFNVQTGATLDLQGNGTLSSSGSPASTLGNAGTLTRSTGAGTFTVNAPCNNTGVVNAQSGTLRFTATYAQTAGTTRLNGGILSTASFLDFQGGLLTGAGTVNGNVKASAQVAPGLSPGQLTVVGSYTNALTTLLSLELGGAGQGTGYDYVEITGRAWLDGMLSVSLLNNFSPSLGDSFEVMRFGSRTNRFARFTGLKLGDGLYLRPDFSSTNVVLVTTNLPIPTFSAVTQFADGTLKFQIAGVAGLTCVIEAAQEVTGGWVPILTNDNSGLVFDLIVTNRNDYPQRFYRARAD